MTFGYSGILSIIVSVFVVVIPSGYRPFTMIDTGLGMILDGEIFKTRTRKS